MTTAMVGKRFQVVIPRKERDRVKLRPNSRVNVEANDNYLVIYPITSEKLRGIGRGLANGTDATAYIRKLRKEWERRA